MTAREAPNAQTWGKAVHEVFTALEIGQVCYVPDAGHTGLIAACLADDAIAATRLTTEEEGVALLAGAWLGGQRGALLMQSSGIGNCINMLGMVRECRFPLLMLVTMRGDWGEFNPWQVPMGQASAATLTAAGVVVERVDDGDAVAETVFAAARLAFNAAQAVAVLIGQRVIGFKDWSK
jgi:sulfopyruvate decarboxylase TPP-binding subunit